MKAYSTDLRQRVVAACDARAGTYEQIAARFSVSVSWVRKVLRQRRDTGSIDPKPHGGGRAPAFDAEAAERLREAVRADDDATLEQLARAAGVECSVPAVFRAPERLGITRKKKTPRAAEQDRPELKAQREAWRAEFAGVDPSRFVFVDESGTSTAMDRRYGRAPSGVRVDGPVPHGHWKVVTLTAAMRLGGVAACLAFDGATNGAIFAQYIERRLLPELRPGDVVVMDDLPAHKSAAVARLADSVGAEVRYLPPYSPDLNPIELMFNKFKGLMRAAAARTVNGVIDAMGDALRAITPADIRGWFHHDGYRYAQS